MIKKIVDTNSGTLIIHNPNQHASLNPAAEDFSFQ